MLAKVYFISFSVTFQKFCDNVAHALTVDVENEDFVHFGA